MKLLNKTAIVTGANFGMGMATAKAFLDKGATVIMQEIKAATYRIILRYNVLTVFRKIAIVLNRLTLNILQFYRQIGVL